jgi:peptide/nickel transport system substrate-binding protein
MYQLGWFPDYSDADNYLSPFFQTDNFLANHFSDPELDKLIPAQAVETDKDKRVGLIEEIQDKVAAQLSTLPFLQGAQVAVSADGVTGVADTLDASFKFRFGVIGRG